MSVRIFCFTLAALIMFAINLNAQENKPVLTGSLKLDNQILAENYDPALNSKAVKMSLPVEGKKSVFLGGLLSLVVPGAGEIYAGEYLKAGIFLAVEAALITTAVVYDNKGDEKTTEFENYADDKWSVVRYAEWINEYRLVPKGESSIPIDQNESLPPWERVEWPELHEGESKAGVGFSHHLAPYSDQQYYEMIGKYPQFSGGWDDFTGDSEYHNISPNFTSYSGMRGDANDQYNVASKAVIGVYINHFLSMLDAVWSTINYNSDLAVNMRVETIQTAHNAEYKPTLNLKFSF